MVDTTARLRGPTSGLSDAQRMCLIGGAVIVAIVCVAVAVELDVEVLKWVKSGPAILLFVVGLVVPKRHPTMWWLVVALGLAAVGDMFFTAVLPSGGLQTVLGMGLFLASYIVLTRAFWRGRTRRSDLLLLLPYAAVALFEIVILWPRISGVMQIGVPTFLLAIVAMAWSSALLPRRGAYARDVALWCVVAAATLFASDAVVGFDLFMPTSGRTRVWVDVFIRFTYFVGWLLVLVAAIDPAPLRTVFRRDARGHGASSSR